MKSTFQSLARKARRIMSTISIILLTVILILVGVLLAWSYPGKPSSFLDENGDPLAGSISEKIFVNINGVEQGMFIKGKNVNNPILLYLHGGMPDYFLTQKYPTKLEDNFTVVWWEQRGSGISFRDDIPKESNTLEQLISDTLAVTNYLRNRFQREKIYLMGHSGGTFFGIQVAAQHPELYYAYIGESQSTYQLKSEKLVYDYMLQEFRGYLKGKMALRLFQQYESLGRRYWGRHLWARGYCVSTIGLDEEKIRKYVQWQEKQEKQVEAVQGKLFD